MGTPPSNAGGSHVITAVSSPTDVHLTFSGGLGTSGEAGYSRKRKERKHETERNERKHECEKMFFLGRTITAVFKSYIHRFALTLKGLDFLFWPLPF